MAQPSLCGIPSLWSPLTHLSFAVYQQTCTYFLNISQNLPFLLLYNHQSKTNHYIIITHQQLLLSMHVPYCSFNPFVSGSKCNPFEMWVEFLSLSFLYLFFFTPFFPLCPYLFLSTHHHHKHLNLFNLIFITFKIKI